jgi:hypothetical protein
MPASRVVGADSVFRQGAEVRGFVDIEDVAEVRNWARFKGHADQLQSHARVPDVPWSTGADVDRNPQHAPLARTRVDDLLGVVDLIEARIPFLPAG